jgi:hypothetical protein
MTLATLIEKLKNHLKEKDIILDHYGSIITNYKIIEINSDNIILESPNNLRFGYHLENLKNFLVCSKFNKL